MRVYNAKIKYKILSTHPDIGCVPNWKEDKVYEYEDDYRIDESRFWSDDEIMSYVKHDMALVAGGGYSTVHIEIVGFACERIG